MCKCIASYKEQYNRCIANGSITVCGREECKKLINLANKVVNCHAYNGPTDFGNAETGFVNLHDVTKLYEHLCNTAESASYAIV